MGSRYEVRFSGAGGQGLVLAGKIFAEAAAIYDGKNATQSQSYGPEARGGASKSEVIVSDEDIDYPKADEVDVLLALTQESCDQYSSGLKPGGVLLVDSHYVKRVPEGDFEVIGLPITDIARDQVGRAVVANIVALGAISELSDIVSQEAISAAIRARVPKGTEELNMKAFQAGVEAMRKYKSENRKG